MFHRLGFTRGAEVGVYQGEFSEALCAVNPGLHLLCVDPWAAITAPRAKDMEAAYRLATKRLTPYGCTLVRLRSVDAAAKVPNQSLDFVYIDADHRAQAVRQDLKAWLPKIRSGGIIAGHDYVDPPTRTLGVKPAVDGFVKRHGISPCWVLTGDHKPSFLWVVD